MVEMVVINTGRVPKLAVVLWEWVSGIQKMMLRGEDDKKKLKSRQPQAVFCPWGIFISCTPKRNVIGDPHGRCPENSGGG
jgi:hypothetical protein